MKCRIKKVGKDSYFNKHLGIAMCPNHWTPRRECKVFASKEKAEAIIEKYNLKDVEVECEE